MKRPSMLFIRAGQLTASALAAYGHRQVLTPNLHRIAARSTVFHNACSPSRNCTSSRFAMMSGQRSWRTRAFGNVAELPASVPTIAHWLRSLGYRTCLWGKMDFVGADQLQGFEERVTTDIYPSHFGWAADRERRIEP